MASSDPGNTGEPAPLLRLYMDENIDFSITAGLRLRGIDVLTVQEDGNEGISDLEVMNRAADLERIVLTNDDDLLREAHSNQESGTEFIGVIYIHKRDVIVGRCIEALDLIARTTETLDFINSVWWLKEYMVDS